MTGVITWTFDCGDGVCIEREQPSTALRPMPHFTTYGGSHFSAGPDVYHPEFQPEVDDFLNLGDIKGDFASKHDPLNGNDIWSPEPGCVPFTSEPGGNAPIVHHASSTSGPGGTTFFSGYSEAVGLDGYMVCPEPAFLMNVGGTAGPGGSTYMTGMDHLGQFGHEADHFTNFTIPVGDFI